jgi:uncharacterized protein (DUF3084 family)
MSETLKPIEDYSEDQLNFILHKIGSFKEESKLRMTRDQQRLDNKLNKQIETKGEVDKLKQSLEAQENVLNDLKANPNADPASIAYQENQIVETQNKIYEAEVGPNVLTSVEARLEQYEIDLMKMQMDFYEQKYTEIQAIKNG